MAGGLKGPDGLNAKQRKWLRLFYGNNPDLNGNASQCYKIAYGMTNDRSAQAAASRLVRQPAMVEAMKKAEAIALAQAGVDADWVKSQAVRIFRRAMGDEPIAVVTGDGDDVQVIERYDHDPATARHALRLIGEHKDVGAFAQQVEHNHTHRLEERLTQRSRTLEAQAVQVPGDEPALPAPGDASAERQRGSIQTKGPAPARIEKDDRLSERDGATPS